MGWYDRKPRRVRDLSCGDTRVYLELEVRRLDCRTCGKVKREQLDLLADNPLYTKRFAHYVGRRCRGAPIKEVAAELKLDWHTVKALDQQYMEAQLMPARPPQRQSALMRSPSGKGIATGLWSAISFVVVRSGLAAKIARKRAWESSMLGSGRRRVRGFGWR